MAEIEVGSTETINSCVIFVLLMTMMTPQIVFGWTKAVLSNLFDPAGRTRHNHEAAGRSSKLKSND